MRSDIADEKLNSFIDGQLGAREAEEILSATQEDADLRVRVCELRNAKALVRHAYERVQPPRRGVSWSGRGRRSGMALAATVLLGVGVAVGWVGRDFSARQNAAGLNLLPGTPLSEAAQRSGKVLVHFDSSDARRVSVALEEIDDMLRVAARADRAVRVEIIANSSGLDVLRPGASEFVERVADLSARYANLTIVACGQTVNRLREKGIEVRLLPSTTVASSALDQVVERMHEGWAYIRI